MITRDRLEILAAEHGLVLRGGFAVTGTDRVPDIDADVPAAMLVLFGNAGSSLWECFSTSPEYADGEPDPLNRWSERIGTGIAGQVGGRALFPFGGPPYRPFIPWAAKAEALAHSKLGMLIHPHYGLWHAYRFAVALPQPVDGFSPAATADLCLACADQPCLAACPVGAFGEDGYDVDKCFGFLDGNPGSDCRTVTCQARLACPEGRPFRYRPDHARFHMDAFHRNLRDGRSL